MKKLLDYLRRRELDKQARALWYSTVMFNANSTEESIVKANNVVTAFYNAFYPRNTGN